MVRTTAAVAFAVLALSASTLAAPVDMSDEMIARDVDYEVEARDYNNYEVDAREYDEDFEAREVDVAEYDARDLEDAEYDAREEDYDYEARDYYDIEEYDARDEYDWEDIIERDATTTSAPASTITPAPTSSAPQSTGTSTVTNTKNGKATKTIITYATPTGCKKPSWGQQVKGNWKKAWKGVKERREKRKAEREAKKAKTASTSASASSTSAASSTITPAPTATGKPTIKNRTTKGPDGTKTIHRTITAAQTPCPENKKRSYGYELDELD